MNSILDPTALYFKNSLINNTATITPSTSILDFSNTSVLRNPVLQISPCNISSVIDSQNNIYIGSCYDNTVGVTQLYNQVGSLSSFSLPTSNKKDLFLLKFNKYGFITGTTTVGVAGTLSALANVTSLSVDSSDNVYFTGLYRRTISIKSFNNTTDVFAGPLVNTDSSFIIKYLSTTATAGSWAYIPSAQIRCSTVDTFNYYNVAGSYAGTIAAFNYQSTNQALTVPNSGSAATQSSFILKYLGDKLIGFTTINNTIGTLVTTNSMISDNTGSIYVGGNLSTDAFAYTYNFSGSSSLGIPLVVGSNPEPSSFIVKYDKFGLFIGLTINPGTTNSLALDPYNNLYSTGSYNNTNSTTVINSLVQPTSNIFYTGLLIGTGGAGSEQQQAAPSISNDNSTVISGGTADNNFIGAVWVFVRNTLTNSYVQYGPKLVATGYSGTSRAGYSVKISGDSSTIITGGHFDNNQAGGAWIFVKSGTRWVQQGPKLVGTSIGSGANFGSAVSLSYDGNIAVVGAQFSDNRVGSAFIYTRSGSVWSLYQPKLVGSGTSGRSNFGNFISMTNDASTIVVGASLDNSTTGSVNIGGAVFIFVRSGPSSEYSQQVKLVGTGFSGSSPGLGTTVTINNDGNTVVAGAPGDNSARGSIFCFVRTGSLLNGTWFQQGPKFGASGTVNASAGQGNVLGMNGSGNVIMFNTSYGAGAGNVVIFTRNGSLSSNARWNQYLGPLLFSLAGTSGSMTSGELSNDGSVFLGTKALFNAAVEGGIAVVVGNTTCMPYNVSSSLMLPTSSVSSSQQSYAMKFIGTGSVYNSFNGVSSPNFANTIGTLFSSFYNSNILQPINSMTVLQGSSSSSVGQSIKANSGNVYLVGQYNSSTSVVNVNNFTTTGTFSSTFYLPTTATTANNTYLVKYSSTSAAVTATGYATLVTESTSLNLTTNASGDVYLGLSVVGPSGVTLNDFSNTQAVTTRYTMTSSVSNTAFYVKYNDQGLSYKYNPIITNNSEPDITVTTSTTTRNNETVSKQYSSSIETITQSGSSISPEPTVITIISPVSTLTNNRPTDTTIVPGSGASNAGSAVQPYSNYNSIQPTMSGPTQQTSPIALTIDNTNEFVYIAGQYSSTNPVSVYNRDGSYSGFNVGKLTANTDIFILKFNFVGRALAWTPIVNTVTSLNNNALTVDKNGSLYVAGSAGASAVPIFNFSPNNTVGSTSFSIPAVVGSAAFIVVYGSDGTTSRWTTFDNGLSISEAFNAITTDSYGSLYATGIMFSTALVNVYNFSSTNSLAITPFSIPATTVANLTIMVLLKWSSTGFAMGYSRLTQSAGSTSSGLALVCDSASNLYCGGYYTGSASVFNILSFSNTVSPLSTTPVFLLQNAPTENAFIIKWSPSGYALAGTTLNSTGPNRVLSLSVDTQDNLYCAGNYAGTAAVRNFANTTVGTVIPFNLPAPTTMNAFAVKWSILGIPLSYTTLSSNGTSSALSIVNDANYNTYLCGFYTNSAIINNFKETAGTLTSAFTLSITEVGVQDSFVIRYGQTTSGLAPVATGFSTMRDTGSGPPFSGQGLALSMDKYNSVHYTGMYSNTLVTNAVPVFNIGPVGSGSRFSYYNGTSPSLFYTKYLASGIAEVPMVGFLGQFIVKVPRSLRTGPFKKTLVLKEIGYTYVVNFDNKSYMVGNSKMGQTLVLYWSGSGWSVYG